MHSAESPDEVAGINRDHIARGEDRCQRVQCDAVVGVVKDWREHDAVGDVEVCVAGGQAPLLEDDGVGHWKLDDVQRFARLIAGGAKAAKIIAQRFVIHIFGIVFDHGDDAVGRNEAGEVVNMAVGIIAKYPAAEPDGVQCSEVVGEDLLVVFARHAGITLLDFTEQTFFGGEERAASVDVDGSAFEDDVAVVR